MELKTILLVIFFLLTLFTLATVSAGENTTDDIVSADDAILQQADENNPLSSEVSIDVEDEMVFQVGSEDYIDITVPSRTKGQLSVTINGDAAGLTYDERDDVIFVLKTGGANSFSLPLDEDMDDDGPVDYAISLDRLPAGKVYDVAVTYTLNGEKTTKSSKITLLAEGWEIDDGKVEIEANARYIHGKANTITITAPIAMIDNLKVAINGKEYALSKSNDRYYVDISQLDLGQYTITVTYNGGLGFTSDSFEIVNLIDYDDVYLYGSQQYVALKLADDANGTLSVTIDEDIVLEERLIEGAVKIPLPQLCAGYHTIRARYTGEDYDVDEVDDVICVNPKITYPARMDVGKNSYMIFEIGDATGTLKVETDYGVYATVKVMGTARISLAKLESGEITMSLEFDDGHGFNYDNQFDIEVREAPIRLVGASNIRMVYGQNAYYRLTVYGEEGTPLKYEEITIKIGKKTFFVDTDANGVVKFRIPKSIAPGKYSIKASYEGSSVKNTLVVKHLLKLKKVKVKKSAKKLILKATVKNVRGKKVTFKFNGKKYAAKTNRKGVAKVTVKNNVLKKLKKGKKVTYQATYLKDSVKYKVRVKQ